jgi:ABC-2 type transport system permease protein
MGTLRLFFLGGLTSYRALFNWLSPWILIPTFLIDPVFQILLFAFVGRNAGVGSDGFYLIGNAVHYAAVPCLFAMGNTVGGERYSGTLPLLLVSPARRIPLFLGRSLPVILNGFVVAVIALVFGGVLLRVRFGVGSLAPLALVVAVSTFSCTGLGLLNAAASLRVRETAVLPNVFLGILLVFSGVNVPVDRLPHWMASASAWMPLTHGIAAARGVAAGGSLQSVSRNVFLEAGVGLLYASAGLVLLAVLEYESRRRATLEMY